MGELTCACLDDEAVTDAFCFIHSGRTFWCGCCEGGSEASQPEGWGYGPRPQDTISAAWWLWRLVWVGLEV